MSRKQRPSNGYLNRSAPAAPFTGTIHSDRELTTESGHADGNSTITQTETAEPQSGAAEKILWLLDAGHGVETPGKRSPEFEYQGQTVQFFEWKQNRIICTLICEIAKQYPQLEIMQLHKGDDDLSLKGRVNRANFFGLGRRSVLVSVHANAAGVGGWSGAEGAETYACPGSLRSIRLSSLFQRSLCDIGFRNRGAKVANFYILTKSKMPAVLTESGFFTSKNEVLRLVDPRYQRKIAEAHVLSMLQVEVSSIPICR